jgi:predicted MPP superfamily phosphohydrolase
MAELLQNYEPNESAVRLMFNFIFAIAIISVFLSISAFEGIWFYKALRYRLGKSGHKCTLLSPKKIIMHILAVFWVGVLYAYYIEPYRLEVTTVNIATNKLKHASLRIVQISDLHCGRTMRNEAKLISMINDIKPDIIVYLGDSLNSVAALPLLKETLTNLHAPLGKFAVRGNCDIGYAPQLDRFSGTGFAVLDADTVRLTKDGDSFYITGLSFGLMSSWPAIVHKIPSDGYSIFLSHASDIVDDFEKDNVDLYLAGHTHGGQIVLPLLGGIHTYRTMHDKTYEAGSYQVGKTRLYVTRGIGMARNIPPLRFYCRPEITVLNIHPESGDRH